MTIYKRFYRAEEYKPTPGGFGGAEPPPRGRASYINKKCVTFLSVHSVVTAVEQ